MLLLLGLLAGADAATPEQVAQPLGVELKVAKALKLVVGDPDGEVLDGRLEVVITNRGKETVRLELPTVHGLVFTDTKSGARHYVVHPCECLGLLRLGRPEGEPLVLEAGKSQKVLLSEWSCDGAWQPPPPGTYELRFRVRPMPEPGLEKRGEIDLAGYVQRCAALLDSASHWAGGAASNVVKVSLKPRKKP